MEIMNNQLNELENEEVGGLAACVIGCGSFCLLGWAMGFSFVASVAVIA